MDKPARPIFVATHPRACSTAFERVFMTRRDVLQCAHEPFGDAFYYGPERLSARFENDEATRLKSGFSESTYKAVTDRLLRDANEGKRFFIKEMAYYLFPPDGKPASLAPSLCQELSNGSATNGTHARPTESANPTVVPLALLRKFHFTFLIRHPRRAIPSYVRCTVPPLSEVTGFYDFMPSEAGYDELRRLFDFLRDEQIVGSATAGQPGADGDRVSITVIDADDLLDRPAEVIEAFCNEVGIEFSPDMLQWGDDENQEYAACAFQKWKGFHNDAIESTSLKPRSHGKSEKKVETAESDDEQWREKFSEDAARLIRECVDANLAHYEYLRSFAIKP